MDSLVTLIIVSLVCESIWEVLKMVWQDGKLSIDRLGALIVSLILAIVTKLDFLSLLGIEVTVPYIGYILTGILISRGSNFIHDLINKVNNVKI